MSGGFAGVGVSADTRPPRAFRSPESRGSQAGLPNGMAM